MSRLISRKVFAAAAAFVAASCAQSGRAADATIPAQQLIDAIGVNTHLIYSDGDYNRLPQVLQALNYLGVRHLRDAAPFRGYRNQDYFAKVASRQYRFCFVTHPNEPLPVKIAAMAALERQYPGAVDAIEGVNEFNNLKGLTYKGLFGAQAAQAFQSDLYDAVRASPVLRRVPVYNFTGPAVPGKADYSNTHPYPRQGQQPLNALTNELRKQQAALPGKPMVITETGYHTLVSFPRGWVGVDGKTAGRLSLTTLFEAVRLGISRVYFYQLLDAYPDLRQVNMEKHFGLFDRQFHPKPLAVGIHNLIDDLRAPPGAPVASPVAPTISSADPNVMAIKVSRPMGSWGVVLYRRAPLWDVPGQRAIELPPATVNIAFAGRRTVTRYNLLDTRAGQRSVAGNTIAVPLSSDPLLIVLDGVT